MQTVAIAIGAFVLYLVAYHTYGRWLARRVFRVEPDRTTPAHEVNDGVDYVPSKRDIVFGHHFTSIAGTGPIVGPAVAVVWGWVPALVWVLVGSIVMGAVHDFGSLVISMRHRGRTIGDLASDVINKRVRVLFLLVMLVGLWVVLAVFGLVIAVIFREYPSSVVPVFAQIPIAVALGVWVRRKGNLILGSIIAVGLMYATIAWSASIQWELYPIVQAFITAHVSEVAFWTIILLVYVFIASVLPVHTLLQPRDFINSWQLLIVMGLLVLGILASRPPIVADAVNFRPEPATPGAHVPSFFPFLFVTIACGAISGFHCLVASGCSSRQLMSERDAQYVGFGAMLTEGFLATLVIIACVAGIGMGTGEFYLYGKGIPATEYPGLLDQIGSEMSESERAAWLESGAPRAHEAWHHHYATWGGEKGLANKLEPFVIGSASMIETLGIEFRLALALMGVFVASFAATTLDSATRLMRYVIAELAGAGRLDPTRSMCGDCGYPIDGLTAPLCPECGSEERSMQKPRAKNVVAAFFMNRYGATAVAVLSAGLLALSDGVRVERVYASADWVNDPFSWTVPVTMGGEFVEPNSIEADFTAEVMKLDGAADVVDHRYSLDLTKAGTGGLVLWPIFGATNQLLGGLALLVITVWLVKQNRPYFVTAIPMAFMLTVTGWAIVDMIHGFATTGTRPLLLVVMSLMLLLEVWIVIEGGILQWKHLARRRTFPSA